MKRVVGSEEWISLSELNIPYLKARVDSGAKTSSIHAINIQPFQKDNETWVNFDVFPIQNDGKRKVSCKALVIDKRVVKSSSGNREHRYVVRTAIGLNDETWDVELTLTNRDSMGYRMLLGREAMIGRIIVDPSESFLAGSVEDEIIFKSYQQFKKPNEGLRIGLLASNQNLYSNRRIIEAAEQRGHEIEFYNIRQCFMKLDATTPQIHYRGGKAIELLDAVIPRIRPAQTFYACALLRLFESLGVFCLNNSDSIIQSRDKLFSLQLLLKI